MPQGQTTPGKAESVTVRGSVDEKNQLSPRTDEKHLTGKDELGDRPKSEPGGTEENASTTEVVPYLTGIKFYLLYSGMLLS